MTQKDLIHTNKMLLNLETLLDAEAKVFKKKGKFFVQIPLEDGPKSVYLTLEAERVGFCIEWFASQMANHVDLKEGRWIYTVEGGAEVIAVIENVKALN